MKIAVTVKKASLDTPLESRFGRTPHFAICDSDTPENIQFIENQAVQEGHGAGVMAAQTLIDLNVAAVVSGKFGPNGEKALQSAGIQQFVFSGEQSIADVLSAYQNNTLKNVSE